MYGENNKSYLRIIVIFVVDVQSGVCFGCRHNVIFTVHNFGSCRNHHGMNALTYDHIKL